jgi:hypothetical protein
MTVLSRSYLKSFWSLLLLTMSEGGGVFKSQMTCVVKCRHWEGLFLSL